jgi:hypothetical protein
MFFFDKNNHGSTLVLVLALTAVFLAFAIGSISFGLLELKLSQNKISSSQAFHIAEAGVNYYRWVLYHDAGEYCNNQTCIGAPDYGPYGPFEYRDFSGDSVAGYYELYLTPPPLNGSTITRIKSIGWTADHPEIKKTIIVECGIPSWAAYSVLCDDNIRFGAGTETWGRIHSNAGVRFDGVANNLITSSVSGYDDPDHISSNEYGVHTHAYQNSSLGYDPKELISYNQPSAYSDIFRAGRSWPIPIVSFDLLDNYVNEMAIKATANGKILPESGKLGYHITLKPNKTMDIRIVKDDNGSCDGVPKEGIKSESNYSLGTSTPPNGVLFVKDKVWIDGRVDNDRITILAFREPYTGNNTDIIINNDLLYTNYDLRDAIGLIAQRNVTVGLSSEDNLEIDAGMIAKEGRIGRNYYKCSECGLECQRNNLVVRGSLATRLRYGFAYTDGTGYKYRNIIYDNNFTYNPPPHFPTTGDYTFLSWKTD